MTCTTATTPPCGSTSSSSCGLLWRFSLERAPSDHRAHSVGVKPQVSVIVPCYNEAATIGLLLEALARQDCGRDLMEVLLSDGMSQDATRQGAPQIAARYEDFTLRSIDNPVRSIPAALNRAIAAARGEVLIRLDAPSIPAEDYVRRCLETLRSTGAANVGGPWG